MTADLIEQSQSGNLDATLELVNKFKPYLREYAYILNFDDAYDKLLIDFLALIKTIQLHKLNNCTEGTLITYIQRSTFNSYIKQSIRIKKLRNISLYSELSDNELYYIDFTYSCNDDYSSIELQCVTSY